VFDSAGNIAYESKHRKPKWVDNAELERFRKCELEDPNFSPEQSRNNKIRIEDPFVRHPGSNKVFDHISDLDIAKYIIGTAYLEKVKMAEDAVIPTEPSMIDLSLFFNEMITPLDPQILLGGEFVKKETSPFEEIFEIR